jgi:tetratricopeptide (TPR) repeat protein
VTRKLRKPTASPAAPGAPAPRAWWLALATFALAVALYWPALGHDFVRYDDPDYVLNNPHVLAGLTAPGFAWAMTSFEASNWHPLTWLSHMLDCQLVGVAPGGHHRTSVLLHAANVTLLFLVLLAMTGALWRSAFVAALFAVHPLNVESVAWVAERKNVLCTLFGLLAIAAYLRYVRQPGPGRLALVAAALALGLMAKPMLVTLPLLLLLLDYWPLARWAPGRPAWPLLREKLPLLALSAASALVTLAAQRPALRAVDEAPFDARVANAVVAYGKYVALTLWPARLAFFYPHAWSALAPESIAAASVFLLAVTAAVFRLRRTAPHLAVGWLWYLASLVPVIGLVQVGAQAMADRYAYIPAIGLFVAIVWGVADVAGRWPGGRRVAGALGLCAILALAVASRRQLAYWQDSFTLAEHAVAVTTDNYVAQTNLGAAYVMQRRWAEAIPHLEAALAIAPHYPPAFPLLGLALANVGRTDEALRALEAVPITTYDPGMLSDLGEALYRRAPQAAIVYLRRAVAGDPRLVRARVSLGAALLVTGDVGEAERVFAEAERLDGSAATRAAIDAARRERAP